MSNKNPENLNPMTCEDINDIEEDYLNGVLSGTPEEERVTRHLKSCADCRKKLWAYQELLGRLFASLEPVPPPPYIKTALLDKLNPSAASGETQPVPTQPGSRPVRPDQPHLRRKWLRWPVLTQAVTVALVIGLGLWVFMLNLELQTTRLLQSQSQQLLTLAAAPDSAIWEMRTGQAYDPTAPRARMYVQSDTNFYLVTASNFQPAPVGQVYMVWYVQSAQVQSGGKFIPNGKGQVDLKIVRPDLNTARAEITACFITLEKINGSTEQPNNPPIVRWNKG